MDDYHAKRVFANLMSLTLLIDYYWSIDKKNYFKLSCRYICECKIRWLSGGARDSNAVAPSSSPGWYQSNSKVLTKTVRLVWLKEKKNFNIFKLCNFFFIFTIWIIFRSWIELFIARVIKSLNVWRPKIIRPCYYFWKNAPIMSKKWPVNGLPSFHLFFFENPKRKKTVFSWKINLLFK